MKRLRVYISGPISGTTDYKERFLVADETLRNAGYKPVNPTVMFGCFQWLFTLLPYGLQMFMDCMVLSTCKRIYLMTGWEKSRGAKLEKAVADYHGIESIKLVL